MRKSFKFTTESGSTYNKIVDLQKGFDLAHGFGWFCTIQLDSEHVGFYTFSFGKNKFESYRKANNIFMSKVNYGL